MSIEEKLDQVIELLTRIDAKLLRQVGPENPLTDIPTPLKPTKGMLEFQRSVEFIGRMERTHYLTAVRNQATESGQVKQFRFNTSITASIDEKIKKTGAQFYKDLKTWSENYIRAVEADGEKTQQRAIARLTARA